VGAAFLFLSSGTVACCEEKVERQDAAEGAPSGASSATNSRDEEDYEDENDEKEYIQENLDTEEDPVYWNIPEVDPETDCFLCRTHRQGPCRPQWRSFEFCAKDDKEEDGHVCAPFVKCFEKCWLQHLNLYLLIAMTLHQEVADAIQEDFPPGQRQTGRSAADWQPTIDWREWETVVEDEEEGLRDMIQHVTALFENFDATTTPVWKVYDRQQEEPWVINVEGQIPAHYQRRVLRFVYAVDQENRVLGFAEFSPTYDMYLVAKEGRPANPASHRLLISMVPGLTQLIRLQAVYAVLVRNKPESGTPEDAVPPQGTAESIDPDHMEHDTADGAEVGDTAIFVETEWIPLPGSKGITSPGTTMA
jgi:hypothetical protein